ncbi:MAG: ABC transporter substrate-binding protein, partial [Rhodospirillaceae bacterium]
VRLDCANDRYLNDEEVCQAVVGMLARIGVRVTLDAKPRTLHFPKLQNDQTDFYMLGWGTDTTDVHNYFDFLAMPHSVWNRTGYQNEDFFEIVDAIAVEMDDEKRDSMIREASEILREAYPYIPLHHQFLAWATVKRLSFPISIRNMPAFRYARFE